METSTSRVIAIAQALIEVLPEPSALELADKFYSWPIEDRHRNLEDFVKLRIKPDSKSMTSLKVYAALYGTSVFDVRESFQNQGF